MGEKAALDHKKALAGPIAKAIHLRYAGLLELSVNCEKSQQGKRPNC